MIRELHLSGGPYELGYQHGRQVAGRRPRLVEVIRHRLNLLAESDLDVGVHQQELHTAWEVQAPDTLAMLHGLSEALELDWKDYFRYTIATYLMDRARKPHDGDQGCTTWAAAGEQVVNGAGLLVKNRDYWPDHQELQCLARIRPQRGFAYLNLTSAGSPGVFSSGINAAGLAVADTHVASLDIGPGAPRYGLMMDILSQHDRVPSALDYLRTKTFMGNGTLILLDAAGEMAVVECAHTSPAVIRSYEDFLVSTNHYTTAHLDDQWLPRQPDDHLKGNSESRYARVQAALRSSRGRVDLAWAQALMRSHNGPLESICRHSKLDPLSVTISSAIYEPGTASLHLANGRPCRVQYQDYRVMSD